MTYGIEVINPDVNRVILDGSSPLYVIPAIRVTGKALTFEALSDIPWPYQQRGSRTPPFGWTYNPSGEDDWTMDHLIIKQTFQLDLQYPLTSHDPPMVFISQNAPSIGRWVISASNIHTWMPNTVLTPIGVPGRWTGVRFDIFIFAEVWAHREAYWWREANEVVAYERANAPDLSKHFILVGHGVKPTANGYGLVVFDKDGRVVFNSDSNIAKAVASTSRWLYSGRSGGSGYYEERWVSSVSAPSGNAYVLFSPYQQYRRYNNEMSEVAMTSCKGSPRRIITGGRSGSPAHTPIIWIEPMKPVEYW